MSSHPHPDTEAAIRLEDLAWPEIAERFQRDPRLLVPIGSCTQHGPHLPVATDTIITGAVASGIALRHDVLLGPLIPVGASSRRDAGYAGTSSLRAKTLLRVLNELVADWERQGARELVLLTSYGHEPHYSALVGVMSERSQLRAVDLNVVDLSPILGRSIRPERAARVETSLMLFLAPHLVRRDLIRDEIVSEAALEDLLEGSEPLPLPGSSGVVGKASQASAEMGKHLYEHLVSYVGDRLYGPDSRADGIAKD